MLAKWKMERMLVPRSKRKFKQSIAMILPDTNYGSITTALTTTTTNTSITTFTTGIT